MHLISFLSFIYLISPLSLDLPPLKSTPKPLTLTPQHLTLNISFTLPRPSFDPPSNLSFLSSPFQCSLQHASAKLNTIQSFVLPQDPSWHEKAFIHLPTKQLIYMLDIPTASLHAYSYAFDQFLFLTTFQLTVALHNDSTLQEPFLIASDDQSALYLFSFSATWVIPTNTILTQTIPHPPIAVDKVIALPHHLLALRRMKGLYLINQDNLTITKQINTFNNTPLIPIDIIRELNRIYVLDYSKGVFIFSLDMDEMHAIETPIEGTKQFLRVSNHTIFIGQYHSTGTTVMEVQYTNDKYYFVRYFKVEEYINWMQPVTIPIHTSAAIQNKNEKMLMYITSYNQISFYSYGMDPRIIHRVSNGVKLQIVGAQKVFPIQEDQFIIVTLEQLIYGRIIIERPKLKCMGKGKAGTFNLSYVVNSTCGDAFNEYCEWNVSKEIIVQDPEGAQLQKDLLMIAIAAAVAFFFAGLLFMIEWRHKKMVVLSRLKDQIIRYRDKHKRMQPFVEENTQNNQSIDIQLPVE